MGLLKIIFSIVGILILAVIGIAAYLYFTDYAAQGKVTDRGNDSGGDYVVVTPNLVPSYHYKAYLDSNTYQFVCTGYKVEFRVQTHGYKVWDATNTLVYDSTTGQANTSAALRCAAGNSRPVI